MDDSRLQVQRSILSASALTHHVLSRYDLPDPIICEFWNHSINDTYLVKAGETKYFLRVSPTGWRTVDQINAEIELLKLLGQKRLSIPQAILQKDGTAIQALNAPEGIRYGVLFSFVHGTSEDMTETVSRKYGQAVAEFHAVTDGYPLNREGLHFKPEDMLDKPLALLQPLFAEHPEDYEYLVNLAPNLKSRAEKLPRTAPIFGVCHGDLNAGNFLIHNGEGWSLVDFEYFGYGWRIFDIAIFFNTQLVDRGRTDQVKRILDSFLAGYQAVRKLTADWMHYPHLSSCAKSGCWE
jgi:Ser/Thr protein kinase RdoA (MazF antagonist)